MDKENNEYSDERFEELCLKLASENPDTLLEKILHDIKIHTAGADQSDDITTLILKLN
jgi:serine phosphatase RsbU (regulator of sigma subunit)